MTRSAIAEELGACPFCNGRIAATLDPPAALHSLPYCAEFTRLDAEKFLQAVREKREAAPKCATASCNELPAVRVFWPGQTRDMCIKCAQRAQNVAAAMGFTVAVQPIVVPS